MAEWTVASIEAQIAEKFGDVGRTVCNTIIAWATSKPTLRIARGGLKQDLSINIVHKPSELVVLRIWDYGAVELQFEYLIRKKPFSDLRLRESYRDRLLQVSEIPDEKLDKRPSVDFAGLAEAAKMKAFLEAHDWVVKRMDAVPYH